MKVDANASPDTVMLGRIQQQGGKGEARPAGRRDSASIPRSKGKVQRLQNERKGVAERRERLIKATRQRGEPLSSIRVKLTQFEAKMRSLDEQISVATAEQAQAQLDEAMQKHGRATLLPDAQTELDAKQSGLLAEINLAQTVAAARSKAAGEAKVAAKKTEAIQDRRVDLKKRP